MTILSKSLLEEYKLEKYQFGTDVRKLEQLYGLSGKIIYEGRWISRRKQKIIIVEMNDVVTEREALFYLELNDHNHIIQTLGYVEDDLNLTILIQEFAEHNDLGTVLIENQFDISPVILREMFIQVADAMSYVADKNIVHGDLGCRNVLVFRVDTSNPKNNLVKITDFGLARWIEHPPTNEDLTVIPIRYCAPEILRNNVHSSYSEKSDVYSMGALIWEALSNGEFPYSSIADDKIVKTRKLNNEILPQPEFCDAELWKLLNQCWDNNRKRRPTFESIKNSLSDIKVTNVRNSRYSIAPYRLPDDYEYELDVDVTMKDLLDGYFGRTYSAEWISKRKPPIIMIMMEHEIPEHEARVYIEFDIHPYIVHTFGFIENKQGLTLLLQERAPYNNLQTLLITGEFQPSLVVLVAIFLQIVEAMAYVASQGIVHGDLRCGNVLVFQKNQSKPTENLVKLANFSLAHQNDASFVDNRRLLIPVRYCALEILRSVGRSNYSELSDVYSMGVLMWEACSQGKLPYETSKTNSQLRRQKLSGEKLPKPTNCNDQMWSIMKECWLNEPTIRYNFEEMKKRLSYSYVELNSNKSYQYERNNNLTQNRSFIGENGRFYEGDWISKKDSSIHLLIINGPTAEYQASLYTNLSFHLHIIHTFGLVENDRQLIMLLQEQALHGNLQTLLQTGKFRPSSKVLVQIFLQIVNAMLYISSQSIVHGDLRCANVLVFQMDPSEPNNNLVKLTNFSLARSKNQPVINDRLPESYVRYCAPEILTSDNGSNYSEASDVYSMGVLMYEACLKGEIPYGRHTSDRDVRQRRMDKVQLSQPKDCPNSLWTQIKNCWCNDIDVRANFEYLQSVLPTIDVTTIDYELCNHCKENIPKNEMENHQKRCPQKRSTDVQHRDPIHFTRCNHCGERCLGSELEEHRKVCTFRISPPPPPSQKPCQYCHRQYLSTAIKDHEKICPAKPKPPAPQPRPSPIRFEACIYCHKQYPVTSLVDHQESCSLKPTSRMNQLSSWICCCCAKE